MTAHAQPTITSVAARVAGLPHLSMDDLWKLWDEHFDERPGHHHRGWLESRLAYKIQERAFGGLKPSLRRSSKRSAKPASCRSSCATTPSAYCPAPSSRASTTTSSIACWYGARAISTIRGNALEQFNLM